MSKNDWYTMFKLCQGDWDLDTLTEAIKDPLFELLRSQDERDTGIAVATALVAVYNYPEIDQDEDVVQACIVAASERHPLAWSPDDFTDVARSFSAKLDGGITQLAQDFLDDHYGNIPPTWLVDLAIIGEDVKRDSEQYITLPNDNALYIFKRY